MKKLFAAFALLGFTAATAVAQVHVTVRPPPPPQVVVSVPAPPRVVVRAPAPRVVVVAPQPVVYVDGPRRHKCKKWNRGNGHAYGHCKRYR